MKMLVVLLAALFITTSAEAKHRHIHHHRHHVTHVTPCSFFCPTPSPRGVAIANKLNFGGPVYHDRLGRVVANPAGCPRTAFCACGAAVRVFGAPIRALWTAASWFKFPRSAPVPGSVAVRSHHVFVLEADLGGGVWEVYDANSGGHLTRIHSRSIAGYTIVNPHGA